MPNLTIDATSLRVPEGITILEAARKAKIRIPTLCHLDNVQAIGACRVCMVEVDGAKTLVASCVTPVTEGMVVHTNTRRVREARRQVVELMLSDHEGDCLTCPRNGQCELQTVAEELGIRKVTYPGAKSRPVVDTSTPALTRDTGKCILCRRCVTVCDTIQGLKAIFPQKRGFATVIGPAFAAPLDTVVCVQCGQCAAVCPVGALSETEEMHKAWQALDDPNKLVVVQTAPAVRAALGECFGLPPGTAVTGKMTAALRHLGFDYVFDTEFTADLTIMEEGTEFLKRLTTALKEKQPVALPQFTSCCPAWVKYAEHYYPELLPNISTCKSPQQMFGAAAKTYFSKRVAKHPRDITVVSIMPCTAKKFEARRPEMKDSWVEDVDYVLTTRELGKMIKQAGIDFNALPDEQMDSPLGMSTGAADMFAISGGVMEAALRTGYEIVTGREFPFKNLHLEPIVGLQGIKEAFIPIVSPQPDWAFLDGATLKVAVVHGLRNAQKLIGMIRRKEAEYHFVEVMACPGGCIGGGGQPRMTDDAVREARTRAILKEDEGRKIRKSHENPDIKKIYEEFFGQPLGQRSHTFLHTHYRERQRI